MDTRIPQNLGMMYSVELPVGNGHCQHRIISDLTFWVFDKLLLSVLWMALILL